jgi:hypothetical protein
VLIRNFRRALRRAIAAGDALFHVDKTGAFGDGDSEVALTAGYGLDIGKSMELDILMPADLDQFGRDYSHRAIIRRKGLVQLGHHAADGGRLFNDVHIIAGICKVKGSLHTGNATSDYYHRSNFLTHYTTSTKGY